MKIIRGSYDISYNQGKKKKAVVHFVLCNLLLSQKPLNDFHHFHLVAAFLTITLKVIAHPFYWNQDTEFPRTEFRCSAWFTPISQ